MANVPKRVAERLTKAIKRFQPILTNARSRDDGEADTVMIVTDMLQEVFGYDKYSDITAEYAIRATFCDLAIKIDGTLQKLIEVKAVGLDLKENHVRQAIDYAANQGVDWVILTNGVNWRVYKVHFTKPIDQELVLDIDFCGLNARSEKDVESLFLLSKEGLAKSVLGDFHVQKQALSRFFVAAMVQSPTVLEVIRRELRRVSPDVRIEVDDIQRVLATEVLKREVQEGDKADEAKRKIRHASDRPLRSRREKTSEKPAAPADLSTAPVPPSDGSAT